MRLGRIVPMPGGLYYEHSGTGYLRPPSLGKESAMQVILNSWKEIAVYIGRGVRTVQRWERELALPVRRPRGKARSAVIAVPSEVDEWLRSSRIRVLDEPSKKPSVPPRSSKDTAQSVTARRVTREAA